MINTKNKVLTIIMSLLLALCLCVVISGCSKSKDNQSKDKETKTEQNTTENLYQANESVNNYLNKYNKVNADDKITADVFKPYNHHGSDHEDQGKAILNKSEIIVSEDSKSSKKKGPTMSVYIGYTQNTSGAEQTESIKQYFIKHLRTFDESITQDEALQVWNEKVVPTKQSSEYKDIEIEPSGSGNGNVMYVKIQKKDFKFE